MQIQLDETSEALDAAHRLSEQLDKKEEMVAALRAEGFQNSITKAFITSLLK